MPRRYTAILAMVVLAGLLAATPTLAQSPQEFMQKAVYHHVYDEHIFRVSPRDFRFLVDNLVGVLAVASQPDFRRRHPRLMGFNLSQLEGTPGDFTLGVQNNRARVVMQWLSDKQLMYVAQVTMNKLGLSITGQAMTLLTLSYDDPGSPQFRVQFTVGFQPSSAVLAAALKPVIGAFGQEMDRLGRRVLGLADDFLQVYNSEREGAFSRSGLLARVASLNQQRLELAKWAEGAGPRTQGQAHGPLAWALALGGGALLLLLGYGAGFFWADKSRSRREARLLKRAVRAQREQEALDRQLARALARRRLEPAESRAALEEHRRLSRELAERMERLADELRSADASPEDG